MTLIDLYQPATPVELFQTALGIYRRYWQLWLALALLALVPPLLIQSLATSAQADIIDGALFEDVMGYFERGDMPPDALISDLTGQFVSSSLIAFGLTALTLIVQAVVLGGAGAVMTRDAYRGQAVALGPALQQALGARVTALVGGHLIVGLALLMLLFASGLTLLLCVGIVGLGFAVYMYVAWFPLLAPALVLERGPLSALVLRAWHFGKQRVWQLFRAVVGFLAARLVLGFVLGAAVGLVAGLLSPDLVDPLSLLVGLVTAVLVAPLEVIYYTLLYEDTRARAVAGLAVAPDPEAPVSAPEAPFFTAADLPNIFGVGMLALGGLVFVYCVLTLVLSIFAVPMLGGL